MKNAVKYFIQGLLLIAPFAVTAFVLLEIFNILDNLIPKEIVIWSNDSGAVHIGDIPGLGILLLLLVILAIGFLGNTVLAEFLMARFQAVISKAPLIKSLYDSIKDLTSALFGNKKKFNKPVMFQENSNDNIFRVGFVTQESIQDITDQKGYCTVYLPHSYAISGMIVFVKTEVVKPLNMSSGQAMKFIVSGGVLNLEEIKEEEKKA
jgi:uncharacterized membrane protein